MLFTISNIFLKFVTGVLAIGPPVGHFLGGYEVTLAGPCLNTNDQITCMFDGIEVHMIIRLTNYLL